MASSKQVRAGRAFVELFATDTALSRTLDAAAGKVKRFAGTVASIGLKSAAAGGAILAPLGKSLFDALGKGAEIKRIATQYGQTTTSISELAGAFQAAGADMGEFSSTLDGLSEKIKAAADNNAELVDGLQGLKGRDLINLPIEKQLDRIAKRIGGGKWLASDQANVAKELGLEKLLPYLREGEKGIAKLKAEGRKRGGVMSADEIERSAAAMKAFNTIMDETANTITAVGAALFPTLDQTKEVSERIRDAFSAAREWVAENKNLIIAVAGLGAGLVGLGVALGVLKIVLGGIALGIGAVGAALTVLLSPIGIAAFALAGVATVFIRCTKEGQQFRQNVGEVLENVAGTFKETWGGIVEAVKAGDLAGAFKIAGAGIKAVWYEILLALKKAWNSFIKGLTDVIKNNPMLLPVIGAAAGTAVGGPIGTAVGLGAGVAANQIDFERHLSTDLTNAEAGLREAKAELQNLIAGRAQGPVKVDAQGNPILGFALNLAEWTTKYLKPIQDGHQEAMNLGNRQKGIFSGPAAQQLGYGDQVAKRQLDIAVKQAANVQELVKEAKEQGQNMKKVLGLVTWN